MLFFIIVIGVGFVFAQVYNDSGIFAFAVLFSTIMSVISYWYSDKIVLSLAKATPVSENDDPRLYNTVENLAITAGLPMPQIYIIFDSAPNAFATGRNPQNAVIAVTTGLLEKLNKTELEGVLAHELSHIGNRDILISTVAVILVGFISLIADIFTRSAFFRAFGGGDDENNKSSGVLALIGIVLSILAPIVATLMQLAISRKREFLADASGALLTRYPEGLASALEKISRDQTQLRSVQNTTAHLWIEDPFKEEAKVSFLHKLFMTHPPVNDRIKALRNMSA